MFFIYRCVVWTGDGRVFFYNPSTRTSVWERPEDLFDKIEVDKAISTPPNQLLGSLQLNRTDEAGPPVEIAVCTESESSAECEEVPKKKLKSLFTGKLILHKQSKFPYFFYFFLEEVVVEPEKPVMDVAKEAAMEAEIRAAKERALLPLDVRVKSFKEMLKEKDVRILHLLNYTHDNLHIIHVRT